MDRKFTRFLTAALACTMLTGCGISQAQLDEITARYDEKIAALEASVASLETTLAGMDSESVSKDEARNRNWIIVTDYIDNLGRTDVSC